MPEGYWKTGLEKRECKKGLTNLVITDLGFTDLRPEKGRPVCKEEKKITDLGSEKGRPVCKEEKKITDLGPEKGRWSVKRKRRLQTWDWKRSAGL